MKKRRVVEINGRKYPRMFSRVYLSGFDPDRLKQKTVAVFGVGGIGALVAEMLARMGVGKIIIVDKDIVEEENLNRLGYYVCDLGKPKVEVLKRRLDELNNIRGKNFPLKVEAYYVNIFDFPEIGDIVKNSDCIIVAFDDIDARLEVNSAALKYNKVLIDGGASTNGLRGRVTVVKPYVWPCLGCLYSPDVLVKEGEVDTLTCNVSLPTTMAVIASIQVDQCLRYLLNKGGLSPLTLISFEDGIIITKFNSLSRRGDCPYCSR